MNNRTTVIYIILGILIVGGVIVFASMQNDDTDLSPTTNATSTNTGSNTSTTGSNEVPLAPTSTIKVAMLDTAGITTGPSRGCDKVVMITRVIPGTPQVLNGAMQELFAIDTENVNGYFSFIARTNNTLKFSNATIDNGTAKIYLTGSLSGLAGVCDDPRAQIQIEETAKQFSSVSAVEIYLNGTKTNLTPSQQ